MFVKSDYFKKNVMLLEWQITISEGKLFQMLVILYKKEYFLIY